MSLMSDQENLTPNRSRVPRQDLFEMPVEWFTFADYVLAVIRHWKLIIVIVGVFLVAGASKVFLDGQHPVPYPYTTVIEIGRFADGTLLEDAQTVKTRLETVYIPRALIDHALKGNYDQERYNVQVNNAAVKGDAGALLLLQSKGSKGNKDEILSIHQDIVALLLSDHGTKAEIVKQALEKEKFSAEIKLEELTSKESFFPRRHKLIDDTAVLLRAQINTTSELVNSMEKDRSSALVSAASKETLDQSLATTLLLVDTDISRNQERIRALEERLRITIENDRNALEQEELENKRQQKEQEQAISEIELKSNNIQKTATLMPPSQLLKGTKQIPWRNAGIYGAIGLVLALIAIGFSEMGVSAKRYASKICA